MADIPNPPGFEHDRLEPEAHVSRDDRDPLLALAEGREARRAAIIDRLLQACVVAVYGLVVGLLVLGVAYLGVSRRADEVARALRDEAKFREQNRVVLACLTDRSRCSSEQLRDALDALANNRTPPSIPPPMVTTTTQPAATTVPVIPGQRQPSPTSTPPPSPPSTTTTTPPPPPTTKPCSTIPVVGTCRPGGGGTNPNRRTQ